MNSTSPCPSSADSHFGPLVEVCRRSFDFTLFFEDSFLSITPSILLLLLAPLRMLKLHNKQRRVAGRNFQHVKILAISIYGILDLILLVLWSITPVQRTRTALTSATLSFVNIFVFIFLSYIEHQKSLRPSDLLNVYLFFSVIFDSIRARTLWLAGINRSITTVFIASLIIKATILVFEATEKRRYLNSEDQRRSPEETSGLLGRSFFTWLNKLITLGFRKILVMDDLYPLDEKMTAESLQRRFMRSWNRSCPETNHKLFRTIWRSLRWEFLSPVPSRLALVTFTICQPLLLNEVLSYLRNPKDVNSTNHGIGLILAYAVVYLGIAISTGFHYHLVCRFLVMFRSTLVSSIYKKTTDISLIALDDSAAVTLMSTDVERILDGLRNMHDLWANLIQVCISTYLLERELGLACIAPIFISLLCVALSVFLGGLAGKRQGTWMKVLQKRVGVTSNMLSSMKGVKMAGLTTKLTAMIQSLRIDEIESASKYRKILIWAVTIGYTPQLLSPVLAFAVYIARFRVTGDTLDTSRLFTSLSLISLLTQPLSQALQSIPALMAAISCFERIQKFLLAESRIDHRMLALTVPMNQYTQLSSRSSLRQMSNENSDEMDLVNETSHHSQASINSLSGSSDIITVINAAFGWQKDGKHVLRDINLCIKRSDVVMICGPVASGKSTLLKALLGEMPSSKGFVYISSLSVAFCDQTPWLINASVQKNVLGFSRFDINWYNAVVHACMLEEDIATFPNGDQTLVGSNGISLSGGQKQRLAMARAVYAKEDIAMFDDVFSGLDSTTQSSVFSRLFSRNGLLRKTGTTCIIATHAVSLLPSADHIIALDSKGKIVEQGSFDQLQTNPGYVSSLTTQRISSIVEDTAPAFAHNFSKSERSTTTTPDGSSRQVGDMAVYLYYFKSVGFWNIAFAFGLVTSVAGLLNFPTVWLKLWSEANNSHPWDRVAYYLGIYGAFQVSCLLSISVLAWHAIDTMAVISGTNLHWITLKNVMSAPMSYFSKTDRGQIINRFSQDILLIDDELPVALLNTAFNGFSVIAQAVLIALASRYIVISYPFLLTIFYYIQNYYLRTSRQLRFMELEAKSPLYAHFLESLSGLATIRAFRWQNKSHTLTEQLLDESQKPYYLLLMIQRWLTLVLDLITMILAVVVVSMAVRFRETISPGLTGVALINITSFAENLTASVQKWTLLETSIGATSRTKAFGAETGSENLPYESDVPPESWPLNGQMQFEHLSATYKTDDKPALEDICMTIRAGEKIGICGRSGSGKSSVLLALFRMIEISQGAIKIDGLDISTIPRQEVRARLNAIPQEPYFLHGTIRLNLDPYETYTDNDEALIQALRKVGLWDSIEAKGGLNIELDVDGLSHGQRQLFCLARAILRPGKIVVLDEVTSSVDHKTDVEMQQIIRTEFANCTIIAVAHRLDTILDFDRIAVLDQGKMVEFDRPDVLLGRKSAFKDLFEMYELKKGEEVDGDLGIGTITDIGGSI